MMQKSKSYIILLIFFCTTVAAQKSFPTKEDNPNWKVVHTITTYPAIKTIYNYQLEKDTLINSILYQKVSNNGGYFRESENKVFYRLGNSDREYLLYDFDLNINDTVYCGFNLKLDSDLDTTKFWLSQMDSVILEGSRHKRLTMDFNPIDDIIYSMYWIEGVGSSIHPFYPSLSIGPPGGYSELLCFHLEGNKIFQNTSYSNCEIPSSLNRFKKNSDIRIYPNPAKDYCIIENSLPNTVCLIYSISGVKMDAINLSEANQQIDLSSFFPGVYMLKFMGTDSSYSNKLLTIK